MRGFYRPCQLIIIIIIKRMLLKCHEVKKNFKNTLQYTITTGAAQFNAVQLVE